MARVSNPLMSGRAKGSIGGITFADWKGMGVARRQPIPSRRMRRTQPANRSLLGFLSREYTTLTQGQRELWELYALNHPQDDDFGGTFIMSGQNAYIMLNHSSVRLGGSTALQVTPPTDPPAGSIENLTVLTGATNPGDIDLAWTLLGSPLVTDFNEIRMAGPFQSPARQEVHSRFRFMYSPAGNATSLTAIDLVEKTWYWFNVRAIDEFGQTSAWHTGQATPKETP